MATEARLRANKAYRKRNPERTNYTRIIGTARSLIEAKQGTKAAEAIAWAKKDGRYYDDLKALKEAIDKMNI